MATKLTDNWATPAACVCDFGWYAQGGQLEPLLAYFVNNQSYPPADWTWSSGGVTYSTSYKTYVTALNQTTVFDATDSLSLGVPKTVVPPGIQVISYNWDFGNGQTGIGPTVQTSYNYVTPPPDTVVTLTIVDSLGRQYATKHPINLTSLTFPHGTENRQVQGSGRT